jgi:hypothetical protein
MFRNIRPKVRVSMSGKETNDMSPAGMILSFLMAGLAITLAVLFSRNRHQQLLHQERMAALEKGVAVPVVEPQRPWSTRVYLLRGLIWSFSGLAVIACLAGLAAASHRTRTPTEIAWDAKQLSEAAEIPREEARKLVQKDADTNPRDMPQSVSLLGLIPLGVGLAYLVFYYTDESRKRAGLDRA